MAGEETGQFYWCLRHKRVEAADRCGSELLMGPYASASEAEGYAEKAKSRNEAWDDEDERWENA